MAKQKSKYDIEKLTELASLTAKLVDEIGDLVKPGVTAMDLENFALEKCQEEGVEPAFLGYEGYKYALCVSVNDEVVHALPTADKVFKVGDVVSVDFGLKLNGYYSDHCRTFPVGKLKPQHQRLLQVGEQAVLNAIKQAKIGNKIGDLSYQMQSTAESAGFSVVSTYVGHAIGKKLHESPEIPAIGKPGIGETLQENMVLCIECQVCENSAQLIHDQDGWTTRTVDKGYSVMFEHMVLITPNGPRILTKLKK